MLKDLTNISPITRPIAAAVAALLLIGIMTALTGTASPECGLPEVEPMLHFATGAGEGVALSPDGDVYVGNINSGEIWRAPHGEMSVPSLVVDLLEAEGPFNFLLGMVVAPDGSLYAAVNALLDPTLHGLWKVDADGKASRIAAAPAFFASALNDVARDPDGNLYASDSLPGEIWRLTPEGDFDLWSESDLLKGGFFPALGADFGVNGLAYHRGALYGAVTMSGRIVRLPIGFDGSPGTPTVVAEDTALVGADGLELDALGNIYVTNNFKNVVQRIRASDGAIETVLASGPLSAPAGMAISANHRTLYIANLSTSAAIPQPLAPALVAVEFPRPLVSRGCFAGR